MSTELQLAPGDRQLVATKLPLGPVPRTLQRIVGMAIGVPFGIGIAGLSGAILGISGALYFTWIVGWTAVALTRFRRFATDNNLALRALGRGELAKARDVFTRWATTRFNAINSMARHNLAWTLMLEGRLDEAATLFADTAQHYQRSLTRNALLPTTRLDAALCHALLGDLDRAEIWRANAELPVKGPPRPAFLGMMALVRAVIDCRRGNAVQGSVALEHAWREHEAVMSGDTLRLMRVVRAFACAAADGPRNQGLVERVLGDMRPRYQREFAFLSINWPEMAAFLAAHELAG